eukprot:scaffold1130_cov195-Pinguiococcus_pyrenoidosus.AAC.52
MEPAWAFSTSASFVPSFPSRDGLAAVGGEAHALHVVGVLAMRVRLTERRSIVHDDLEVLSRGQDAIRPRRLVGDGQHPRRVTDHLAHEVSRVPHDRLAAQAAAALR